MNYHGTSFVLNEKGVLLRGKSGSGKSDLALRLIHQGATLIADDQTEIVAQNDKLIAICPNPLEGKLEVRGVGIIEVPFIKHHPLHMIIDLVNWKEIERLPEEKSEEIEGITCTLYDLAPFESSALEKIKILLSF